MSIWVNIVTTSSILLMISPLHCNCFSCSYSVTLLYQNKMRKNDYFFMAYFKWMKMKSIMMNYFMDPKTIRAGTGIGVASAPVVSKHNATLRDLIRSLKSADDLSLPSISPFILYGYDCSVSKVSLLLWQQWVYISLVFISAMKKNARHLLQTLSISPHCSWM